MGTVLFAGVFDLSWWQLLLVALGLTRVLAPVDN